MPREGRLLEILVKHMQEFLASEGVEVKSPEEFYRDGQKIGEIDITLRGDFGSSRIFVGIECRDRPSEPPQGREWIREIQGKKQDLGAHKMIAASSTGFTSQAVELADSFDIDLLHVENVDGLDLHDWFQTITVLWNEETYEINGVVDIKTQPKNLKVTLQFGPDTPFLRIPGSGRPVSVNELISSRLDAAFAALPPGDRIDKSRALVEITAPMEAEYQGTNYRVTKVSIPLSLSRETVHAKLLLNACRRLSDEKVIAMTGHCRIETALRKFNMIVVAKTSKTDPSMRDLKVQFLTDDNKPFELPAGTHLALFGAKDDREHH